jgi:8-oxo-dGTP diphosphatase
LLHHRARFCPLCGGPLLPAPVEGRDRPRCGGCGFVYFWNPATAAAGVVLRGDEVLLVRRGIEPFRGSWALPAGYQEVDEDPRDTARREIREETGIEAEVTSLFDVIWIPDDPRKPANVLVYLCRVAGGELEAGSDATEAAWFHLDRLPDDVGFDNRERILSRLPREG